MTDTINLQNDEKYEKLRMKLVQNIPCGACIYEYREGKLIATLLNDRYLDMVGRKFDNFESAPIIEVVHPDDRARLMQALGVAIQTQQRAEIDIRIQHSNGQYRIFHVAGVVERGDDGRIIIYVTYNPVSEAELAFKEMIPVALETVMASSTDLSFVKDRDLVYLCCSKSFAKMAGLKSPKDIKGKTDYEVFPKEIADSYRRDDLRLMQSGESMVDHIEALPTKGGRDRYSSTSKYLLKDNFDNIIGLYGVGRDITASRETSTRLKFLSDSVLGGFALFEVYNNTIKALQISEGVSALTGYPEKEFYAACKKSELPFVFDEDVNVLRTQIEQLVIHNSPINCSVRIRDRKEAVKWLNFRGICGARSEGKVLIDMVMFDVTEQKLVEQQLKASHEAIEVASKNSGTAFWIYDIDLLQVTPEFSNYETALNRADNVPYSQIEHGIVFPDDKEAYMEMYQKLFDGAHHSECTVRLRHNHTNQYEWQHIVYTRLDDEYHKGHKAIGFSINVDIEQENRLRYEHELQLRRELTKNSVLYYQLNITTNTIEEYDSVIGATEGMKKGVHANEKIRKGILSKIPSEYKQAVRNTIFTEPLVEMHQKGITGTSVTYQREFPDGIHWVRADATILERPNSGDVLAFINVQDIDNEKKAQMAMEAVMDEEIESVMLLSVKTRHAHFIQNKVNLGELDINSDFDYAPVIKELVKDNVIEEDKADAYDYFDYEKLYNRLIEKSFIKHVYRVHYKNNVYRKKTRAFFLDDTKQDIVIIRRDITDLYAEEQHQKQILQNAVDAANEANKAKSDFLSTMSHDMRTPLNAVLSFSDEVMTADADETQLKEYLDKIHSSGTYLLGIINDVLDMSKIEQKKVVLNPTPYTFNEFSKSINTVIGELSKNKGVEFVFNCNSTEFTSILVDRMRFNQIFVNLLSNAVKFTPAGGKVEFIIQHAIAQRDGVITNRYVVRDNGIGMSKDFLGHAFDSFSQERRNNISDRNQGTGLGLAIVKSLVDMMHGSISVESELGKGTTFTVELPLRTSDYVKEEEIAPKPVNNLNGAQILLCEDNFVNTEIAVNLLQKRGCIVTCVENGQEGLFKFNNSKEGFFDAILMDIRMPVLDGLETTKAIRKLKRADAKTVPIIAMTANAFSEDIERSLAAGMDAHLAKPIVPSLMYEALAKHLRKKQ